MKVEITVPGMGESVTTGIIAAWLKEDGERVAEGEDLFELETDKATLAVPSTASGVVTRKAGEGNEVEVGQLVAVVDTEAAADTGEQSETDSSSAAAESGAGADTDGGSAADAAPTAKSVGEAGAVPPMTPSVRRLVEQYDLDPRSIGATGPEGRITKEDALSALLEKAESMMASSPASAAADGGVAASREPVRKPLSNLRKRIAENLVSSQRESAHLTTFNEIDLSAVMSLRKQYRDEFEKKHGVRLGFMSFFVKATCEALKLFPQANSSIDGDDLLTSPGCHIGVAVSTERGLLVPVIRDADLKSFAAIEQEIVSFATRAKEKKIGVDELTGGTCTITNGGVFGSLLSTPIPTPGQTAILGMHAIQKRPVVVDDQIVIRPMMYVAVTYDHRVMDGREAVSFLVKIKQLIEDPSQLLLGL